MTVLREEGGVFGSWPPNPGEDAAAEFMELIAGALKGASDSRAADSAPCIFFTVAETRRLLALLKARRLQ